MVRNVETDYRTLASQQLNARSMSR
jgi:hypothetical protein